MFETVLKKVVKNCNHLTIWLIVSERKNILKIISHKFNIIFSCKFMLNSKKKFVNCLEPGKKALIFMNHNL